MTSEQGSSNGGTPDGRPTLLKELLKDRHLLTYRRFCQEYDRVARRTARELVGTFPSPSTYKRWLNGRISGQPRAEACSVLEAMFPRYTVTELLADRSAADDDPQVAEGARQVIVPDQVSGVAPNDSSLRYSHSTGETLANLLALAHADNTDAIEFDKFTFSEASSTAVILAWLVGSARFDVPESGKPVSLREVEEVATTTETLDRLDRQFGGNYSRELAVKYLEKRVVPMLHNPCTELVRRELFHAASVLCEVIGYMAYDARMHGVGQRYLVQALRLAKESGNSAYGSFVLATISHQALYLDHPEHALTLALAAQHSYRGDAISAVTTEAAVLEATAYSVMGDRSGCVDALSRAERSFNRTAIGELPYWASHWDDAVFSSFFATCWINLGDAAEAGPYLDVSWHASHGQVRREVFAAGQLAKAALLENDVERAVRYATIAAEAASSARSKRSHEVVHEVLRRLASRRGSKAVRELEARVSLLLPSEAS